MWEGVGCDGGSTCYFNGVEPLHMAPCSSRCLPDPCHYLQNFITQKWAKTHSRKKKTQRVKNNLNLSNQSPHYSLLSRGQGSRVNAAVGVGTGLRVGGGGGRVGHSDAVVLRLERRQVQLLQEVRHATRHHPADAGTGKHGLWVVLVREQVVKSSLLEGAVCADDHLGIV